MDDIFRNLMRGILFPHAHRRPKDDMLQNDEEDLETHDNFQDAMSSDFDRTVNDMMKEMDDMFRDMDEAFTIFQFPPHEENGAHSHITLSRFPDSPPQSGTLRDSMLKEPETDNNPKIEPQEIHHWPYLSRPHFTQIFPVERNKEDVEVINKEDPTRMVPHTPRKWSWNTMKSSSFHKHSFLDGTSEEHVTQRDGKGKEIITVTRSRGDQKHVTTTTRDLTTGEEQVDEQIFNIDKNDEEAFKSQKLSWPFGSMREPRSLPAILPQLTPSVPPLDQKAPGIFSQIFGSIFKDK